MDKTVLKAFMALQQQNSLKKASPAYDPDAHNMAPRKGYTNAAVVIIGAGISGMCMAIDMIRKNKSRDFIILERGSHIGGTWNDSKYPGCCCDVWSHLYSYSFEPNPNWSRLYPGQEEIYEYLVGVAEKWGLYKHIRFNTSVEEATWSDDEKRWAVKVNVSGDKTVQYGAEYTIATDFLVSGVGQLNTPHYPEVEGLDDFQGKLMHSARWDWSYPLEGKKIGIIGNGATAVQIIPEVAKVCESLTVFQRTPNWVIPRDDAPISAAMQTAFKYVPGLRSRYRALLMDVRENLYESTIVKDSPGNVGMRDWSLSYMKKQLPDRPDLWEKLTPNYAPGCKRIIITDDFYPALAQPHVKIETSPIERVTSAGVAVEGQAYDFDLLILATGFRTQEFMYPIKVTGTGGRSLEDIWQGGARAYRGVTVDSLPNFGMMYGPNTNLGHSSIILMIEAQSRYISALIAPVLKARARGETMSIVPRPAKVKQYNEELQARMQTLSFSDPSCSSWYKTAEGLVTNNWAGDVVDYQKSLATIEWDAEYETEGSGAEAVARRSREKVGRVVEETVVPVLAITTCAAITVALTLGCKAAARSPTVQKAIAKVF